MAGSISAANAIYMLGISSIFPAVQQLQGFSADDIFSTDPIDTAELSMGVDGKLSAGFVYTMIPQTITLQADSDSNNLFDAWWGAEQVAGDKFSCFGTIALPGLSKVWVLTNGFLTSYSPIPDAKKTLQPRKFGITWNLITPSLTV